MSLPSSNSPFGSLAEKHTIETPEQTTLDFAVAGIGSRFLALAFDTLLQIALGMGFGLLMFLASLALPNSSVWFGGGLILGAFLIYLGYFAFFEIQWNGQ